MSVNATNPPFAAVAYEVAGFLLCAVVAAVATVAVIAVTGVAPGVALFAGLYQLPVAIPFAVMLRKRAPRRFVLGFIVAMALYAAFSGVLAALIALGVLAA